MNLSNEQAKRIGAALEAGNKIEAIKLYREFTGSDLRAAKDAVEALIAELVQREPQKYAKLNQPAQGCSPILLAVVVLALAGAAVFFLVMK